MPRARLRTWAASTLVLRWSWASTASSGAAVPCAAPRPPWAPMVMYRMVSSRSVCSACTRLVIPLPSRENCSTRWKASALRAEESTLNPPRNSAANVGSRTSSSRRDRTRQFFSGERSPGRGIPSDGERPATAGPASRPASGRRAAGRRAAVRRAAARRVRPGQARRRCRPGSAAPPTSPGGPPPPARCWRWWRTGQLGRPVRRHREPRCCLSCLAWTAQYLHLSPGKRPAPTEPRLLSGPGIATRIPDRHSTRRRLNRVRSSL